MVDFSRSLRRDDFDTVARASIDASRTHQAAFEKIALSEKRQARRAPPRRHAYQSALRPSVSTCRMRPVATCTA